MTPSILDDSRGGLFGQNSELRSRSLKSQLNISRLCLWTSGFNFSVSTNLRGCSAKSSRKIIQVSTLSRKIIWDAYLPKPNSADWRQTDNYGPFTILAASILDATRSRFAKIRSSGENFQVTIRDLTVLSIDVRHQLLCQHKLIWM